MPDLVIFTYLEMDNEKLYYREFSALTWTCPCGCIKPPITPSAARSRGFCDLVAETVRSAGIMV